MRSQGLTWRQYCLNSHSDTGIAAINKWLGVAGYPTSLWGPDPQQAANWPGQTFGGWPAQPLPLERVLSRMERHVQHCATCKKGMAQVTTFCRVVTALAGAAAVLATLLGMVAALSPQGVAAVGGWVPPAGVAALSCALGWLAAKAWAFREERFVSGLANWRRIGGFSTVRGSCEGEEREGAAPTPTHSGCHQLDGLRPCFQPAIGGGCCCFVAFATW